MSYAPQGQMGYQANMNPYGGPQVNMQVGAPGQMNPYGQPVMQVDVHGQSHGKKHKKSSSDSDKKKKKHHHQAQPQQYPPQQQYPQLQQQYPPHQQYPPQQYGAQMGVQQPYTMGQPAQPVMIIQTAPKHNHFFGLRPQSAFCHKCNRDVHTKVDRDTTNNQLIGCVLLCVCFPPYCFIPYIMPGCYKYKHKCPECHETLGVRNPQ
eukprot:403346944